LANKIFPSSSIFTIHSHPHRARNTIKHLIVTRVSFQIETSLARMSIDPIRTSVARTPWRTVTPASTAKSVPERRNTYATLSRQVTHCFKSSQSGVVTFVQRMEIDSASAYP
jgi:hypothetical protein